MMRDQARKLVAVRDRPLPEASRLVPVGEEHTGGLPPGSRRRIGDAEWLRFEGYIEEIFAALGMEVGTPGTERTPARFLKALSDATAGYEGDPKLVTTFPNERRRDAGSPVGQIVEGPVSFYALCEHHALPFHGFVHVGYVANDRIIGISKLIRVVRLFARRFTVQERLGEQIAAALEELVQPHGVAVHLEAVHLCTRMRGVGEEHSRTVTTVWRGGYVDDSERRREFLTEVHNHHPWT